MADLDHYMTKLTQKMISQANITYEINNNVPLIGKHETLWSKLSDVVKAA